MKAGEAMYYKQNTNEIQLVVMSFDDTLTNLTKLRYNYYRRLCKLYKHDIEKKDFVKHMSSIREMFHDCPIPEDLLNTETLISKIEEDLYEYTRLYQLKKRDGADELLEYLHQKNIRFVLTSTHPQSYTQRLLDLGGFYYRPDRVYYDDEKTPLLPDPTLYGTILEDYQLEPHQVLIITSNPASLEACNDLKLNVFYYPILEEPTIAMKIRSLAVISSLLEAINIIISGDQFGFENNDLLLTGDDDTTTLFNRYEELIHHYQDNQEAKDCIETIYQNEFMRLQSQLEQEAVSAPILPILEDSLTEEVPDFTTLQESIEETQKDIVPIVIPSSVEVTAKEDVEETHKKEIEELFKDETATFDINDIEATKEMDLFSLAKEEEKQLDADNQNQEVDDDNQRTRVFTKEELKMFGVTEEDLDRDDDNDEMYGQPSLFFSLLANIGYALMDSLLICFIVGIAFIVLRDSQIPLLHTIYTMALSFTDAVVATFPSIGHTVQSSLKTSAFFGGYVTTFLAVSGIMYLLLDLKVIIQYILKKKKKPTH